MDQTRQLAVSGGRGLRRAAQHRPALVEIHVAGDDIPVPQREIGFPERSSAVSGLQQVLLRLFALGDVSLDHDVVDHAARLRLTGCT